MSINKQIINDFIKTAMSIKRQMNRIQKFPIGPEHITVQQMEIMSLIEDEKSLSVKDLASIFGITSSAITQAIDRLVRMGTLSRKEDGNDRRSVSIAFTEKGKEMYLKLKDLQIAHLGRILSAATEQEIEDFIKVTKKIIGL